MASTVAPRAYFYDEVSDVCMRYLADEEGINLRTSIADGAFPFISRLSNEIFKKILDEQITVGFSDSYDFYAPESLGYKLNRVESGYSHLNYLKEQAHNDKLKNIIVSIFYIALMAGIIMGAYSLASGNVANGKLIAGLVVGGLFCSNFVLAILDELMIQRTDKDEEEISKTKVVIFAALKAFLLPFFMINNYNRYASAVQRNLSFNVHELREEIATVRDFLNRNGSALKTALVGSAPEEQLARLELDRLMKAFSWHRT